MLPNADPAGIVGVDENRAIPGLVEGVNQPLNQAEQNSANESDMDIDHAPVKMVVVDGIVMGPQVCLLIV